MADAIIFDFDGVILDSFPDQFKWFRHICGVLHKDFPYSSLDEFRKDYREPVYPGMYTFLGFDWLAEKETIWREYNNHKANADIKIFEEINAVIKTLFDKGYTLAIASSNTNEAIYRHLKEHGLTGYFKVIVGKDDLPVENGEPLIKPHPACILLALDKLSCKPDDALYIGDHPCDIIAARTVKDYLGKAVPVMAATYGYAAKRDLLNLNPNYVADSPEDILKQLRYIQAFV